MTQKIILLTNGGASAQAVYHRVSSKYSIHSVVVEESVPKKQFLKRRVQRLGWITVAGQILFQLFIPPVLGLLSRSRIRNIEKKYSLSSAPLPEQATKYVPSVNSKLCRQYLESEQPDIVLVSGTRIISQKTLSSCSAVWINIHAGVTPAYRGVHGGYWALAQGDKALCGVTVHRVDSGIDTGGVLFQTTITPVSKDNFSTYPLLQLGEGLQGLEEVLENITSGKIEEIPPKTTKSKLWYHPTLWQYIANRVRKGVK